MTADAFLLPYNRQVGRVRRRLGMRRTTYRSPSRRRRRVASQGRKGRRIRMLEETISTKGEETPEAGKKAPRKSKKGGRKAAKKRAKEVAAPKPVKRSKKAAKKGKKGGRKSRKAAKVMVIPRGAEGAPSILVVGGAAQAEPIWLKYSQMTPVKPSRRASVPTNIKVGNLVGWRTDSGKERIGVVQDFRGDCAAIGMGGKIEIIRICRLSKLADKVKES